MVLRCSTIFTGSLWGFKWTLKSYRSFKKLCVMILLTLQISPTPTNPDPDCCRRASPCYVLPRTRTIYGDRSFSSRASRLYNPLPLNVRFAPSVVVFKIFLKTYTTTFLILTISPFVKCFEPLGKALYEHVNIIILITPREPGWVQWEFSPSSDA